MTHNKPLLSDAQIRTLLESQPPLPKVGLHFKASPVLMAEHGLHPSQLGLSGPSPRIDPLREIWAVGSDGDRARMAQLIGTVLTTIQWGSHLDEAERVLFPLPKRYQIPEGAKAWFRRGRIGQEAEMGLLSHLPAVLCGEGGPWAELNKPLRVSLADLGCGDGWKAGYLLSQLLRHGLEVDSYVPIDGSTHCLDRSEEHIEKLQGQHWQERAAAQGRIFRVHAGFSDASALRELGNLSRRDDLPCLWAMLGKTLGNFRAAERQRILGALADYLKQDDLLVIGVGHWDTDREHGEPALQDFLLKTLRPYTSAESRRFSLTPLEAIWKLRLMDAGSYQGDLLDNAYFRVSVSDDPDGAGAHSDIHGCLKLKADTPLYGSPPDAPVSMRAPGQFYFPEGTEIETVRSHLFNIRELNAMYRDAGLQPRAYLVDRQRGLVLCCVGLSKGRAWRRQEPLVLSLAELKARKRGRSLH